MTGWLIRLWRTLFVLPPRCTCDGGKAGAIDYGHADYCERYGVTRAEALLRLEVAESVPSEGEERWRYQTELATRIILRQEEQLRQLEERRDELMEALDAAPYPSDVDDLKGAIVVLGDPLEVCPMSTLAAAPAVIRVTADGAEVWKHRYWPSGWQLRTFGRGANLSPGTEHTIRELRRIQELLRAVPYSTAREQRIADITRDLLERLT